MRTIDLIVLHCSATPPEADIGRAEIDRWHRERGWAGVGYHWIIRRDGTVEQGRPEAAVGAHAEGHNAKSIGVCLVGGVRRAGGRLVAEDNFTPAQWQSLERLVRSLRHRFPAAKIVGHRDLNRGKECPSFSVREWLLREGLLEEIAWDSGAAPPKPLPASRTVQGATASGVGGTVAGLGLLADQSDNVANAASSVSWLAQPGSWLALALIAIVVGGSIWAVWGRRRLQKETGA